jgi:hypothetical protein
MGIANGLRMRQVPSPVLAFQIFSVSAFPRMAVRPSGHFKNQQSKTVTRKSGRNLT